MIEAQRRLAARAGQPNNLAPGGQGFRDQLLPGVGGAGMLPPRMAAMPPRPPPPPQASIEQLMVRLSIFSWMLLIFFVLNSFFLPYTTGLRI
jgi:hypothetical protein